MKRNDELELYIHIPFCVKKCAYCDFLSAPASDDVIEAYVQALIREITFYRGKFTQIVSTIFVGGGTPSVLNEHQISRIFDAVRTNFVISEFAEITLEVNPGSVTKSKFRQYFECGINRISFGLQSTDDNVLKMLGRIHTFNQFLGNYEMARECGFANINIDMMMALPGQSIAQWEKELKTIVDLNPEHISPYSLIVEENTAFYELYGPGKKYESLLPDEELERQMYHHTETILKQSGYTRYEISNYAKQDYQCRHNLGYWERKPYLGLGLGAASLTPENQRYSNTSNLQLYLEHAHNCEKLKQDMEQLSDLHILEETVFLGLRKMEGIKLTSALIEHYGDNIETMIRQGYLEKSDTNIFLTSKGIDVSNHVFTNILFGKE